MNIKTVQTNVPPDVVDFGVGQPTLSLLPLEMMREAAAHRLAQGDSSLLQYGPSEGDGYFRLALAAFLSQGYGSPVPFEQLLVTGGVSQGLDLICTLFTQPGDIVFVEEPTYFLAPCIFADHKLKVVSIPTDEDGLSIDALEEQLARQRPVFLYTIPSFHNPTGITLSQTRREQLLALSHKHNFLIVADEVYQLLNYSTTPPAPLASYAEQGSVLSISSFSKISAPGLRLGWLQTNPTFVQRIAESGLLDSGGSLNHFTSSIMRSALELGLQAQYLTTLKETYSHRIEVLDRALRQHLPETITYHKPKGGFFFWLRLPEGTDSFQLLPLAKQYKVGFKPGKNFSARGRMQNYIRLSFAHYEAERLEEGVRRLAQVLGNA